MTMIIHTNRAFGRKNKMCSGRDKMKILRREIRLIRKPTPAEEILKRELEDQNISFVFQKPVVRGKYHRFIDFYFPRKTGISLAVEIDGGYHNSEEQIERDKIREDWIKLHTGCDFIRFKNEDVFKNILDVVEKIKLLIAKPQTRIF